MVGWGGRVGRRDDEGEGVGAVGEEGDIEISGYNRHTGLFDLTRTKAHYWLRRSDIPEECKQLKGLQLACCILVSCDIEVVEYHDSWARVKATQSEIWQALSGSRSDTDCPID